MVLTSKDIKRAKKETGLSNRDFVLDKIRYYSKELGLGCRAYNDFVVSALSYWKLVLILKRG